MNDKLSAASAFFKRMWTKVCAFSNILWKKTVVCSKFAWAKIVIFSKFAWAKAIVFAHFVWTYLKKAYAFLAPKVVSGCKFLCRKASELIKSAFKDKQRLILAVILIVAILFSCIAVVRAVKGVVNGVAGIFASDKADQDAGEDASLPEEIESPGEEAVVPSEAIASTPVEPAE